LWNEAPKSINHKVHKEKTQYQLAMKKSSIAKIFNLIGVKFTRETSTPRSLGRGKEGGEVLIFFRYECLLVNRWPDICDIVLERRQF
jgi:hypothetical protein